MQKGLLVKIEDENQFHCYFELLDKLRERELEEGSADSLLLKELSEAIENYSEPDIEPEEQMNNETRVLAEFIRARVGHGWHGPCFSPPFRVCSPEEHSRFDRWLSKNIFRLEPHWIILNSNGANPFGADGGWFENKKDAETFAKTMNELGADSNGK